MVLNLLRNPSSHGTRLAFIECEKVSMLACTMLRVDPYDGSPVLDYRIEDDHVESRILDPRTEIATATEKHWQRLTPEQLSSHVMSNTVVARWLVRRLGVHPLIRACTPSANNGVQDHSERVAA